MNRQKSFGGDSKKLEKSTGSKKWVHPAEALLRGHIVYNTKFLGHVEVSEPKGSEVIKEAIRKMKFNKQLKKAEGQKPPKVELTISVDGVTVQEPKYKVIQHQYPLHRISYCADDKNDKRIFTFIAKDADSNQHRCFVFDSDKCAEEITLTIGQAFDLAYKKFMESSRGDMDTRKQTLLLHKKVQQLTQENLTLKERVANLERLVEPHLLEQLDTTPNNNDKSPTSPNSPLDDDSSPTAKLVQSDSSKFFRSLQFHIPLIPLPKPGKSRSSPRHTTKKMEGGSYDQMPLVQSPPAVDLLGTEAPEVGTKLENLVFEDNFVVDANVNGTSNGTNGTNGYAHSPPSQATPVLAPPPPVPPRQNSVTSPQPNKQDVDLFGAEPFSPNKPPPVPSRDAFGMDSFNPGDLDKQIQKVDRELMDLQAGFSQGLSFGPDDFTLADLDPLNKK